MTIALKIGVCHLFAELFADTFGILAYLYAAGTISVLLFQTSLYRIGYLLVFVYLYCHFISPFRVFFLYIIISQIYYKSIIILLISNLQKTLGKTLKM